MTVESHAILHPDMGWGCPLAILVACGSFAALIARSKGNSVGLAFILGLGLGPIGVLIALIDKGPTQVEAVPWSNAANAPTRCSAVDAARWQCVLPSGHPQPHSTR